MCFCDEQPQLVLIRIQFTTIEPCRHCKFIKEKIDSGSSNITYTLSNHRIEDILTKPLPTAEEHVQCSERQAWHDCLPLSLRGSIANLELLFCSCYCRY